MCAGERRTADEVDPVTELLAQKGEYMRNEVVTLDLLGCNTELRCDRIAFVLVHRYLLTHASARRKDASRLCSMASDSNRSKSLRA